MTARSTRSTRGKHARAPVRPDAEGESDDGGSSDAYRSPVDADGTDGDSDDDDTDDDDDFGSPVGNGGKRKRSSKAGNSSPRRPLAGATTKSSTKTPRLSARKKPAATQASGKGRAQVTAGDNYPRAAGDAGLTPSAPDGGEEEDDEGDDYSSYSDHDPASSEDFDLEEGQEIKGRIFAAPKTGHAPPGEISRNTFKFLVNLQNPERNDREWFKMHEPAYRLAEQEWKSFVALLSRRFREVDPELPILPPKDLIHRIYRDVRFSNDKTPYKRHFSMSVSRSGRKGIWAGLQPRGRSLIAGGVWAPGKNELASIRQAIKTDSSQLRRIISSPDFIKLFGPASPSGRGQGARCNVFGHDDQLKVAPKGVAKDHPDIDLLKLRSIAVVKNFTDEEVFSPEFMDILLVVASKITPLVHYLNSAIALPVPPPGDPA